MTRPLLSAGFGMEHIVLQCISEVGIDDVTFQVLAKYLGHSRATLYRTYGSCRNFLRQIHEACLELIDEEFGVAPGGRIVELNEWWTRITTTLRTPYGRAFLAMRPYVAVGLGVERLLRAEVNVLRRFQTWVDPEHPMAPFTPLMTTVWSLLVTASELEPATATELQLRAFAETLLTAHAPRARAADAARVPSFC